MEHEPESGPYHQASEPCPKVGQPFGLVGQRAFGSGIGHKRGRRTIRARNAEEEKTITQARLSVAFDPGTNWPGTAQGLPPAGPTLAAIARGGVTARAKGSLENL